MSSLPPLLRISPSTVLRLRGPDRLRYLNGQVTNDVRLASPTRAVYSAVLNAKGQLDAVCFIREHEDSYLIDAPLSLREDLFARLDRYIIADDVELTDESDRWSLVHCWIERSPDALEGNSLFTPDPGSGRYEADRFTPGYGIDVLTDDPDTLRECPPALSPDEAALFRLKRCSPAWGAELTPGLLPAEAGLDQTAVSFDKGCYLGQEVVSRMKRAGKTNRHLVELELNGEVPCPAPLLSDGAVAGVVTSLAGSGGGAAIGLGFRTRKFGKTDNFDVTGPDGKPSGVSASVVRRLA